MKINADSHTEKLIWQLNHAAIPADAISIIDTINISDNTELIALALIQALSHHHPDVRDAAIEVLVKLAPVSVEPLLGAYQDSPDQTLQACIIKALAQIGHPGAANLLAQVVGTEVANHCQGNVRRIAARGLGLIASTTSDPEVMRLALEKIIWALLTPDDWGLRYAAAVSLQEIATPKAHAALQTALQQEQDNVVRSRIAQALN